MRIIRTGGAVTAATLGLVLLATTAAQAHVTVSTDTAAAGSYAVLTFSVPHGCDDSPTSSLAIQIPEGITSVTPTVNSSWTVTTTQEDLDQPTTDSHGTEITERDAEVTYTAIDPLPADLRDVFELSVRPPEDAAGSTMYFPTVQTCEHGETAWVQIPADGQDADDLDRPAPAITVTPAAGEVGLVDTDPQSTSAAGSPAGAGARGELLALAALLVASLGLGVGVVALLRQRPSA